MGLSGGYKKKGRGDDLFSKPLFFLVLGRRVLSLRRVGLARPASGRLGPEDFNPFRFAEPSQHAFSVAQLAAAVTASTARRVVGGLPSTSEHGRSSWSASA